MQVEGAGTPHNNKAEPRRNPTTVAGVIIAIAMVLTAALIMPFIFEPTIGIGNHWLFLVSVLLGMFLGSRWSVHILGLGVLIAGWVIQARLVYVVIGAFVLRGTGHSPRLKWDSRKAKYSSAYAATYEDGLPGSTVGRLHSYIYLFAALLIVVLILAVVVLSSIGMADWITRLAIVILAVMFVGVVGSYVSEKVFLQPKGFASLERTSAQYLLAAEDALGVRPRDFDTACIDTLLSVPDGSSYELSGWLITAERALDLGDIEEAERAIVRATLIARPIHGTLASTAYREAAFLAAYRDNDAAAARIWQNQVTAPAFEKHTDARVEAAILLAEGEIELARETARRGIAALEKSVLPGAATFDEQFLREILNRLDVTPAPNPEVS